ncbi:Nnf1-domain-containing protein [Lophiostoma macrostomum CBS 122681]|uniref:Nnf1-domain-containing protein n=1 Tax=Lophiostoma macrostomum CBS 122681 TaxID=1314788 RepID=A0A6A6SN95_9PLEO|nr:Nnf1-domain-containing protein [Lophiostoma macrostomum CBS 122681]
MPSVTVPESRSPSPIPAPPIADTPGPRAAGLIKIFDSAVKSTLDKCSPDSFAACFPTIAQYNPDVLGNLRTQIVEQLDKAWRASFEEIVKRRDVVRSLNALDQYIDDAKLRKKRAEENANGQPVEAPIAPHLLSPSEIQLAHLIPFLEEQSSIMNTQLSATQQANTELLSTVTDQRAEIEALVHGLEDVIHDLEASAQLMGQDDVQDLSKHIRELETEMKM